MFLQIGSHRAEQVLVGHFIHFCKTRAQIGSRTVTGGDLLFLLPAFQPPLLCFYSFCAGIPADAPVPLAVFLLLFLMAAGTSPLLSMYSLTAWGTYFHTFSQHFVQFRLKVCILLPIYCLIAFSFSSSYLMVTTACFMFIYLRISK